MLSLERAVDVFSKDREYMSARNLSGRGRGIKRRQSMNPMEFEDSDTKRPFFANQRQVQLDSRFVEPHVSPPREPPRAHEAMPVRQVFEPDGSFSYELDLSGVPIETAAAPPEAGIAAANEEMSDAPHTRKRRHDEMEQMDPNDLTAELEELTLCTPAKRLKREDGTVGTSEDFIFSAEDGMTVDLDGADGFKKLVLFDRNKKVTDLPVTPPWRPTVYDESDEVEEIIRTRDLLRDTKGDEIDYNVRLPSCIYLPPPPARGVVVEEMLPGGAGSASSAYIPRGFGRPSYKVEEVDEDVPVRTTHSPPPNTPRGKSSVKIEILPDDYDDYVDVDGQVESMTIS